MTGTDATVKLGRIFGIPVGLHWSWFFIFFLVTSSLSAGYFPATFPGQTIEFYWIVGTITSLLFFLSVLAHEFGHALVALSFRIPVQGINLLVFGGAAHISREPETPKEEFLIAIAGPAVSLATGLGFGLIWLASHPFPAISTSSEWLARINLALVVFNMLPGFPLDGGRVFRAILWWFTRNSYRASRFASYGSQAVAFGFIGFGIYSAIGGNFFNGVWLVLIGWFLQNASAANQVQVGMHRSLGHIRVGNIMSRNYREIPRHTLVSQLADEMLFASSQPVFFVRDHGKLIGMFSFRDITSIPYSEWDWVSVDQIMTPIDRVAQVQPDMSLFTAMTVMEEMHQAEVPVIIKGEITGLLSRDQVMHYLAVRNDNSVQ